MHSDHWGGCVLLSVTWSCQLLACCVRDGPARQQTHLILVRVIPERHQAAGSKHHKRHPDQISDKKHKQHKSRHNHT